VKLYADRDKGKLITEIILTGLKKELKEKYVKSSS